MNWLKEHEIDSWILKSTFVLMLLFPAFYSPYTDVYQSAYYAGFSWAYFMLVLYMLLQLVWNRKKLLRLSAAGACFWEGFCFIISFPCILTINTWDGTGSRLIIQWRS